MPTVESTLRRHLLTVPEPRLGRAAGPAAIDRTALGNDLLAVSRTNQVYFAVCFAVVVLALIGAGIVTVRFMDSPQRIAALFAALGISITGLMAQMVSLWKQKVIADAILVLSRNLDEPQLKPMLDGLLGKF